MITTYDLPSSASSSLKARNSKAAKTGTFETYEKPSGMVWDGTNLTNSGAKDTSWLLKLEGTNIKFALTIFNHLIAHEAA